MRIAIDLRNHRPFKRFVIHDVPAGKYLKLDRVAEGCSLSAKPGLVRTVLRPQDRRSLIVEIKTLIDEIERRGRLRRMKTRRTRKQMSRDTGSNEYRYTNV